MSKNKILLITIIVLGGLFLICAFGLSLIAQVFLLVGIYCGIGALLCGIALLDRKSGRQPNLILIGVAMAFFGCIFLGALEISPEVTIPLSALFAGAGVLIAAMGIRNRIRAKRQRAPQEKKPWNATIYIGIGLLVGGFVLAIVLFSILPVLMSVGHVMVLAGLIVLGRGIARQKATDSSSGGGVVPIKMVRCIRCSRSVDPAAAWEIAGAKYCADCKQAMEQDVKNQHTVCSVCGVDLPMEYMHVVDDALLCRTCFLKQYGNIDF